MPRPPRAAVAPTLALALSGAIWLVGLAPRLPRPLASVHDKVTHGVAYAALAASTAEALAVLRWGPSPPLGAFLYAAAHGAVLEAMQSLTPRRRAQWGDLAADGAGALVGALGWLWWRRR